MCFTTGGLFYNSLLRGISRASLVPFCHSQSSHFYVLLCSFHNSLHLLLSLFCLHVFLFPSSSHRRSLAIFLISSSALSPSSHQLSIPSLSPPSLGSQSIYYSAKWAYQLSRVLLIEAVTENEELFHLLHLRAR